MPVIRQHVLPREPRAVLRADEKPDRIVILRALQLGDLLCAVPAWRALRHRYPGARIALIGLPWAQSFVARFAMYLDEFIEFPGFPGLPELPTDVERMPAFLGAIQRRQFDLALQMQGDGAVSNVLMPLLGARTSAGFARPGAYRPDPDRYWDYPGDEPEVRRHLRLMSHLGIPSCGEDLEFPLTVDDHRRFERLSATCPLTERQCVCIHPGGRGLNRRWPVERFAAVADALAERGYTVVITGTEAERRLAGRMRLAMRRPAVDLVGHTDLGVLGVLLSRSRLLIANDTGVSHVGAALAVPSVILSTGSDPVRWGPLNRARHRLLLGPPTEPVDVLDQADDLLSTETSTVPS